jgi:hypothetical protein
MSSKTFLSENVAVGKIAVGGNVYGSTFAYNNSNACFAVDGVTNVDNDVACAELWLGYNGSYGNAGFNNSYLEVDLGKTYTISFITIFRRYNC